jgi:hypothetical protein
MGDKKKRNPIREDDVHYEEPSNSHEDEETPSQGADGDSDRDYSDDKEASLKGLLGEGVKKLFTAGISAAFMTEESIRTYLQDLKLPKEVLNLILQNAAKSKEQLMNRVGNEISAVIKKIDFVDEASRFVEGHKFKISAEIEVIKKNGDSK